MLQHGDLMSPSANAFQIIDVYIYGDYEILDEAGQAVPYKRAGSRIAEVQGKPDVRQITSDVLETGVGRIAICGKLCHFIATVVPFIDPSSMRTPADEAPGARRGCPHEP